MTAKLANIYYNDHNIKQSILGQDRNPRTSIPRRNSYYFFGNRSIGCNICLQTRSHSQRSALYYLPSQINLGDPIFSDFYKKASYTLNTGNIVHGEPIYFSVTIPEATASNLPRSISFVNFLLSRDSQYILQSQGLNYIKPLAEGKLDKIPIVIKNMISIAMVA